MRVFLRKHIVAWLLASIFSLANAQSAPVLIFISFSMPRASIQAWLKAGAAIQAPVMIRGLVDQSFKSTIQKMQELMPEHQQGVQLDPTLFSRYHITQVPAVVVRDSVHPQNYDVVYGDTTLSYALQKIADQSDALSDIAHTYFMALRENHAADR